MVTFHRLVSVAAPLLRANVDTDLIIPMDRYLMAAREQMHHYAFETLRFLPDGTDNPDFILNQPPYDKAEILITGANFGCGSSRESAVWALYGWGIRCIIAPSFGNIFYNNCFQNGLLPVVLPEPSVTTLAQLAGGNASPVFDVDLTRQVVTVTDGAEYGFEIDPKRRIQLLEGLDDIGVTLNQLAAIKRHRREDEIKRPWIYLK